MNVVVSIDPDIRAAAFSLFVEGRLRHAGIAKSPIVKGVHDVAACLAQAKVLDDQITDARLRAGILFTPNVFVYEWPRILQASHQKDSKINMDPNDLLALVGVDVGLAMLYPCAQHVTYRPDEWKGGTVEKKAMCQRVWRRLASEEKAVVERRPRGGGLVIDGEKGLSDDILDSVGVGLRYLGRLERIRVFD